MSSSRSTMNIMRGSAVGSKGDGMRRPDISIGEASGTRSILAAIAPTVVNTGPPGAAIVTSTITRKNGAAVDTRHAAGTLRQWSVEVHLLRRVIAAATAAVPCSTITNRQCHLSMTSAGATTAVPEAIVGIVTTDHLRPGWIAEVVVEDDSSGVEEEDQEVVDRSGEAAAEWIAVAAVVGTTRMTSREVTKWTTTGSHLAVVGKVVAKEENAVDLGHLMEGLRRGRDPANGTGTGVGEGGLVRRRHR